jgi:hypothetical protein
MELRLFRRRRAPFAKPPKSGAADQQSRYEEDPNPPAPDRRFRDGFVIVYHFRKSSSGVIN